MLLVPGHGRSTSTVSSFGTKANVVRGARLQEGADEFQEEWKRPPRARYNYSPRHALSCHDNVLRDDPLAGALPTRDAH